MEKVKQLEEILKELISLSKKQKKLYKYYESHPAKTDKAKFKRFEKIITMSQELIILSIKFKTLSAQSYSKFPPGGIAVKPNTDEKIIKNDKDKLNTVLTKEALDEMQRLNSINRNNNEQ